MKQTDFRIAILACAGLLLAANGLSFDAFRFEGNEFQLNGRPFQVMSGELHFQRIPREYWKDRLLMAKAMGLNTISTCVFWNALEPEPGQWNFAGGNDLAAFIRAAQETGLYVIVRPGPYACAEWDFGGLPAWLLRTPDIKVRCSDSRYLAACESYIKKLADEIRGLSINQGGPVLMIQLENEYGSYGNDRAYMLGLKAMWQKAGIESPFFTADGTTPAMLETGTVAGAAIGLDPGTSERQFAEAAKLHRNVPIFCSELYPGWLTHWGEPWAAVKTERVLAELQWLLDNKKSFNLYMFHGGTNFGFSAGANFSDKYEPDVTSYDYDAPLDEQGRPTPKYMALRDLLAKYQASGAPLPDLPDTPPAIEIPPINLDQTTSIFDNLPLPVRSPQPKPMEYFNQNSGLILYRTRLAGHLSGRLILTEVHDYANIYLDGQDVGTVDRTKKETAIELPKRDVPAERLDILVEGMGRINFGPELLDRKGITERVTLNGVTLMDWEVFPLPLDARSIASLKFSVGNTAEFPAAFFRGAFDLETLGDTYLDLSGWEKGIVWVNGHNLGRYWNIGPQRRLYCPAPFLKKGRNEIIIFDLRKRTAAPVRGLRSLREAQAQES
jgi:beta-galactosidase